MKGLVLGAIVAATACGACVSNQEILARLAAQDEAQCASIGAPAGSPNYTDCRLRVAQLRQDRQAIAMQAYANAMRNLQDDPPRRRSTTTSCTRTSSITASCTTD